MGNRCLKKIDIRKSSTKVELSVILLTGWKSFFIFQVTEATGEHGLLDRIWMALSFAMFDTCSSIVRNVRGKWDDISSLTVRILVDNDCRTDWYSKGDVESFVWWKDSMLDRTDLEILRPQLRWFDAVQFLRFYSSLQIWLISVDSNVEWDEDRSDRAVSTIFVSRSFE